MASCSQEMRKNWSNSLHPPPPPPRKIQYKNALKIRHCFCLLVFKHLKLFSKVRKVRKNEKASCCDEKWSQKIAFHVFFGRTKKIQVFLRRKFSPAPPGQNRPFFLWVGSMNSLALDNGACPGEFPVAFDYWVGRAQKYKSWYRLENRWGNKVTWKDYKTRLPCDLRF